MTISSLIKDFVIIALLPAVGIGAGALTFVKYYDTAVTQNLRNLEESLQTHVENEDTELPGNPRGWSRAFYRAHLYYTIHAKCFSIPLLGGLAWILGYIAESLRIWSFLFGGSPFGIPPGAGLRFMAVSAWILWLIFVLIIINRFGVRPEQRVAQKQRELVGEEG